MFDRKLSSKQHVKSILTVKVFLLFFYIFTFRTQPVTIDRVISTSYILKMQFLFGINEVGIYAVFFSRK